MSGVTAGLIMAVAGIAGIVACIAGLIITIPIFARQRKRLLERIESE